MVTTRLLNVLRSAGIGLSAFDVNEWVDTITTACISGVLRLGDYNSKLIDNVLKAWTSNAFVSYPVYDYTYGEQITPWLDKDSFRIRAAGAHTFIRIPHGHTMRADYLNGHLVRVNALTVPGEYSTDVTDTMGSLFPSGIDTEITSVYAVLSSSEEDWSREVWRTGLLLTGERAFIQGLDMLTVVCVAGSDLLSFCDNGILGALSVPVLETRDMLNNSGNLKKIVENVGNSVDNFESSDNSEFLDNYIDLAVNSTGVLVAVGTDTCCAMYCSRVKTGEILDMYVSSGAGTDDVMYLELDTGDTVCVTDLLALCGKGEGSEVYYVMDRMGSYVLSDEYGNTLLGASYGLFQ